MNIPVRMELFGAAIALASGLMLGGAMHPDLTGDDRPAGPQIIAGRAGLRSAGPLDGGATLASYAARTPDYVLGTDATKPMGWPGERAETSAPAPHIAPAQEAPSEPVVLTRAAYDDLPPPPRSIYPSLGAASDHANETAPTITG